MKVAFVSLGCPKNQTDLEYLIGEMADKRFDIVTDVNKADAIIINTCGFLQSAVKEAIENIFDVIASKKKNAKVIVAGCMVERYKSEIAREIPEVDFFTGVGNLKSIITYLDSNNADVEISTDKREFYGEKRLLVNVPYYAYLKIAEGCNNMCSYCTIPSIRGNLVSRPKEDVLAEAKKLTESGVKELIIISQDTTKYGLDRGDTNLLDLLKDLVALPGDFRIRLMYLNPDGVDEQLIDFVANNEKIIKYFDIPVQHISDRILKLMNRKSDSKKIKEVFSCIRKKIPEAFIRTTFIVGFPTETDADYTELLTFLEEFRPDFAGFFPFSREEGTKASLIEDDLPKKSITRRISGLQKLQKKITSERLKRLKKENIKVYVEAPSEEIPFLFEGRAEFQSPEIDGKTYIVEGEINKGYGPYTAVIKRVIYPDIYCRII